MKNTALYNAVDVVTTVRRGASIDDVTMGMRMRMRIEMKCLGPISVWERLNQCA